MRTVTLGKLFEVPIARASASRIKVIPGPEPENFYLYSTSVTLLYDMTGGAPIACIALQYH